MPLTVDRKKRTVKLYTEYKEILNIHQTVLKDMGLLDEKESHAVSSVQPSTEMPVEGGSMEKAKRLLEQTFSLSLGGTEKALPYCVVEMDTGSEALYRGYREFWVAHMRRVEKILPVKIEAGDIENCYVLIMEFCLRLAMQALRLDSPLRSDQKRRIFIEILTKFGVELSKQEKLSKTLQASLFVEHKKWLDILADTADQIDELNRSKPVLKENLKYLKLLENNIIRHLVVCLTDSNLAKQNRWEECLSEDELAVTLQECEERILNAAIEKGLKIVATKGIIETSVVVQRSSIPKLGNEISERDFQEYELVNSGIAGIPDAHRQKHVIGYFNNTPSIQLIVKYLYGLWNKTQIIRHFLGRIDSLVQHAGWLPLLFHVVELNEVDDAIRFQAALCHEVFKLCKSNKVFKTPLGKELGQCMLSDFGVPKSLPKLGQLQDPELLSTVFTHMALDLNQLGQLGTWLGCQVTVNPYLHKTVKIAAQALPLKAIAIPSLPPKKTLSLSFQKTLPMPPKHQRNKSTSLLESESSENMERKRATEKVKLPPETHPFVARNSENKSRSEPATPVGNSPILSRWVVDSSNTEAYPPISSQSPFSKVTKLPTLMSESELPPLEMDNNPDKSDEVNTPEEQNQPLLTLAPLSSGPTFEPVTHLSPENKVPYSVKSSPQKTDSGSPLQQTPVKKLSTSLGNFSQPLFASPDRKDTLRKSAIPDNQQKPKQDPFVSIEMPLSSTIDFQSVDSQEIVEEKTVKLYPAQVPYIKTVVEGLRLNVAEIAQARNIFDTNPNYFNQGSFSPFRREVAKVVESFCSHHMRGLVPDSALFDYKAIREERSDEIAMLQYFCIGSIDDSHLLLFIERMRKLTTRFSFPPMSKYNELISNLEKSLDLYYGGRLKAILKYDINTALQTELETLRKEYQRVNEENIKLQQDLGMSKMKTANLEEENQKLQVQYVSGMNNLANEVKELREQVKEQSIKHQTDIKDMKSEFEPFFKSGKAQDSQQPSEQQRLFRGCNIL